MNVTTTRFAPSPTGLLHAGNYRTAVFAYLHARRHGGRFLLRIEDTDRERSKPEYEANILESLKWLELDFDEQYRQSEHAPRHRECLELLIRNGHAYISKETPKNPGDREEVIRFKNPGGTVLFDDLIRGEISTDVSDLGDFVIARSLDEPVFHLAVVVDDADEGVTHVIRGEDHISNTPRQILIQRALGLPMPLYAHLPLILDQDRAKLSKRRGAKALTEYRDAGFLPESMLNYLALLGWHPDGEREYLTRNELIEAFDLARVQKGGASFDEDKLRSINQHWMRKLSNDAYAAALNAPAEFHQKKIFGAIDLLKERAKTFAEARELITPTGELGFLFYEPKLVRETLLAKEPTDRTGIAASALDTVLREINGGGLHSQMTAEGIKEVVMPLANAEETKGKGGRGAFLWPLRYALSGQERSADPFAILALLGPTEAARRIEAAIAILK